MEPAKPIPIDDRIKPGEECNCEPDVEPASDDANTPETATHYYRRCQKCGTCWYSLHCPHDGYQNKCPECKARANQVS